MKWIILKQHLEWNIGMNIRIFFTWRIIWPRKQQCNLLTNPQSKSVQSFPGLIFWGYLEVDFNLDWKKRVENVRYAQRNILKGLIRTQRLHKVSISWTLECTNYVVELCLFQMHQKSSANFHRSNISDSIGFLFPICQASCYNDGLKWIFWVKTLVYWLNIVEYFLISIK